jgi:L-threonylcarbamoyladenylate synthase
MSESKTRILPYSPEALQECAQLLRDGKLVGMPTETVYGLGANALDEAACKSIFTTKGRPLTDPLIVHVHSVE